MNPHRSSPLAGPPAGAEDDSEALRILDAYLSGIEAGRPADPDKLLADHPELADPLRAYFKVMHLAGRLAEDSAAWPERRPGDRSRDGQAAPASQRREGPGEPPSALGSGRITTIDFGPGAPPRVRLREVLEDHEPAVATPPADVPDRDGPGSGRFELQGEIGRGGMGAILRGRDLDLGRELAIKVLLEPHRGDPDVVRRFVEEAQIGGQLQHPGVVPVYELGTFPDRRPYFAMKLVQGRTLAALLRERTSPAQDLPRFLAIFEPVCQTMAYVHARGVIHRDLKPSNIMVGSFGEVQVMDWGLAKVLSQGAIADEAPEAAVTTVRTGPAGSDSESQAGSILGTPAYMAPEQARGEVERIDERADVFGLGAILCEVLTGRPPYVGSTREEVRDRAARGDLADALARLDASGVDAELIELARDCLAADRERRPRSAGEVARRLTAYREGVQERLRAAEWARVEAQARADEEAKRRRLTAALAASVLVTAGVIAGGWAFLARQRAARLAATARAVNGALADVERLRGQAQSAAADDPARWSEAAEAAHRARDLLAQGEADEATRARVADVLDAVEHEHAAAAERATEILRDRALLARLETIRGDRSEHWDPKQTDADYAAAFAAFGVNPDRLDPEEAGKRLGRRSDPVELASYLDDWAVMRRKARGDQEGASWRRLLAASRTADPHPWRTALRDQVGGSDLEPLRRLADARGALEAQSSTSLVLLAVALMGRGDRDRAERVLRHAWELDPGDFWVNFELGEVRRIDGHYDRPDDAIRYLGAAVAIRPRGVAARVALGIALNDAGRLDEAAAAFRAALRIQPDDALARNDLGVVLLEQGRLEEGMAELRAAARLQPDYASPHDGLGNALAALGRHAEAVNEYRAALRIRPDFAQAHGNLASALRVLGRLDESIAESREALRLLPRFPEAQLSLGLALRSRGELDASVAELRRARDLAKSGTDLAGRIDRVLARTERDAALAARLPAVLSGATKPADAAATVEFARLCNLKGFQAAAARLWVEAFRAEPRLAVNPQLPHRYDAACAAALAGCGRGKDDPPPDAAARARWRRQALDWLEADLAAWSSLLETAPPRSRPAVLRRFQHWKADPDLAVLREPGGLADLPADERDACRALWARVERAFGQGREGASP